MREVKEAAQSGIHFPDPVIDLDAIRSHKQGIVKKLSGGLSGLAKARKVSVLTGVAQLSSETSAQLIPPYSSLGMHVDIVELTGDLIPGADQDLVAIWKKCNQKWLGEIMLNTKVVEVMLG